MFRLVAYAPDGVRRFPVVAEESLIGSKPDCDIVLPYAGVAQQHARLHFDGSALRIEDLGSRRGLVVSGRKVRETALEVLDEIRVGGVTLLVEDIREAVGRPRDSAAAAAAAALEVPETPRISPQRMVEHLALISEWVLADPESRTPSEILVRSVLADFGGGALWLLLGEDEQAGVKLAVATRQQWLGCGEEVMDQLRSRLTGPADAAHTEGSPEEEGVSFEGTLGGEPAWCCCHAFTALERGYQLLTAFPRFRPEGWAPAPALRSLGNLVLLGLVHHVGWYEPILPGRQRQQDLVLDPSLPLGVSPRMQQVIEELRSAVDPAVPVLLRGEPGVGKELLARSLHQSGPRRNGPFVVASCAGARPTQLEAELFGAEVPGRDGPVRREGKLTLAHGGTLYLEDVDQLPTDTQARLSRFLRTAEVEPAGGDQGQKVDVRVIASSRESLEEMAGRGEFRVDLAYRLARCTIEVPPVRERKEDLPLLLQSYINRYCHETGKRMQGITMKAKSALLAYDYPGNLEELTNIARQLVYLCPSGRPIDVNLLPDKVRRGASQTVPRIEASSDLGLEGLVASCEQSAIREALRRTHGNKSQAARLLGLSRNGLTIKMARHGIRG
ncbi:MAG TPA: sigma 54-interacting transcriptional regulator [Thermoanaerobaculia bacterium]|nr:sigma 54-interacting transcriptional regulator [Thermoanaerobaculia bacterium]